jgi:outer membrane protein OmpA-like peptidoglycan-associated protein
MFVKLIAPLLAAASLATTASAQDVRSYQTNERVDPRDVARILGGAPEAKPAIRFRSIRLLDEQPATESVESRASVADSGGGGEPVAVATQSRPPRAEPKPAPKALSLPVQFKFDSADILPQARAQLDALAEGIRLLPASQRVIVEGHTDSTGSDAYNLQLSKRRALAVKMYLVSVHGIDESRLRAEGYGKYRPLSEENPYAAENRRVQFRGA